MGLPTMNVGTIEGGSGVNLVPDLAKIGVDIRTVPGMDHEALLLKLKELLSEGEVEVFADSAAGVDRARRGMGAARVRDLQAGPEGKPEARTAPYMTDAANLLKVYAGAPTRGARARAKRRWRTRPTSTATWSASAQSVAIYERIIEDWSKS